MSKTKQILIGLAIGLNLAIVIRYVWVEYLWTYKRPIVQEVHTTQQYINGTNASGSQAVGDKKSGWSIGAGPVRLGSETGIVAIVSKEF